MSDVKLIRLSRAALVADSVCASLFWILAAVLRAFAGADVMRHPLWTASQSLYVACAADEVRHRRCVRGDSPAGRALMYLLELVAPSSGQLASAAAFLSKRCQ